MKKILIINFSIIILLTISFFVYKSYAPIHIVSHSQTPSNKEEISDKSSVSYNVFLHTDGALLKNEYNEIIQLHGISSHGIEWFSDIITYENLEELKKNWNVNVFRIAMYTDSNNTGYIYNPSENKEKVFNVVDMCIKLDMYVIIDWHILNDNNPQIHQEQSKSFFSEVSEKYKNIPNIIYEICNEPNGNTVTWNENIKPYAEKIIPIIRKNSNKSLILVGTPNWCKNLNEAADNPLNYSNVAYTCHFYSGTHKKELRDQIDYCLEKNIPIFVSECGLTNSSGDGEVYYNEFSTWINYLNSKNISWIYWSFSNKNESSAILRSDYSNNSEDGDIAQFPNINDFLTDSGKFLKKVLTTN